MLSVVCCGLWVELDHEQKRAATAFLIVQNLMKLSEKVANLEARLQDLENEIGCYKVVDAKRRKQLTKLLELMEKEKAPNDLQKMLKLIVGLIIDKYILE